MDDKNDQAQDTNPQSRLWLGDTLSPYGLSDEDATLRQADSARWRTLFGTKRAKRFVAIKTDQRPRPTTSVPLVQRDALAAMDKKPRNGPSVDSPVTRSLSSVIFTQTVLAALLVIGVVYGVRAQSTLSTQIKSTLVRVYHTDYSRQVLPTFEKLWSQIRTSSLKGSTGTAVSSGSVS